MYTDHDFSDRSTGALWVFMYTDRDLVSRSLLVHTGVEVDKTNVLYSHDRKKINATSCIALFFKLFCSFNEIIVMVSWT